MCSTATIIGCLVGEDEGGTEGLRLTLSVNLDCDSNHNGDPVHKIIVENEESVANVNGVIK